MAKGFICLLQTYKPRNQITIKTKNKMAILNFQKPDKVIMIDSTDFEGKFEFRPLEPGYGLTVGNALRRVLLSSLEGFAPPY